MTQRINLYTAEFRARRQYLSLPWVAVGCGALLLIGIFATVVQWRYGAGVRADIAAAQGEVDALNRTLEVERARLAQHVALPELTRQLQKLQEELAAKAQLVVALQNTPLAVRNGYAPVFEALARHPLDGLWLTRIDVIGDAVNLAGEARRPELVPEYIATLTGDAQFSAQSYEVLTMQRNDQGLMQFEIRRRAGDARP
jgi:Tfp pilus assembly protein PilN